MLKDLIALALLGGAVFTCVTARAADDTAAATPAPPATAAPALPERLAAADTNGDGVLDRSETAANTPRLHRRFDSLDTDKDGMLSPAELEAAIERVAARRK